MHFENCVQVEVFGVSRPFLTFGIIILSLCHWKHVGFYVWLGFEKLVDHTRLRQLWINHASSYKIWLCNFCAIILTIYNTLTTTSITIEHIRFIMFELVGTRDDRTQSARTCLFLFLQLDGLKTPIYFILFPTTQTPTLPFTPNPSPKKPKNLKPNTLFFFFSTNSWYIDTYPKNLILEAMQVLLGAATLFFCCCRVVHLALRTWSHASPIRSRDFLLLLLPCCYIWLSRPGFQDLDKRTLGFTIKT
jgi:hypothetical protein